MTDTAELCRDIQMKLPDAIWMLDALERYRHGARYTEDFATMDGSTYVFGVIEVSLAYTEGSFTWGCWVEVNRNLHDAYLEDFQTEGADRLSGTGLLANSIPGYEDAEKATVRITFSSERRPIFVLEPGNSLADDQQHGLTEEDHHTLDNILFGDDEEEFDEEEYEDEDEEEEGEEYEDDDYDDEEDDEEEDDEEDEKDAR